jgi:hypothetical protein
VLSQEIEVDTPPSPYALSRKMDIEKISQVVVVTWRGTRLLNVNTLPKKKLLMKGISCPAALISRQHLRNLLQGKTALSVLWKTDRTILTALVD